VRILGEDLVAFRDGAGRYGLLAEQCCHRRVSLAYGFVEQDGLRCPYHGWKYDVSGKCIEQPFEPAGSPLIHEACQTAYPVQQMVGILFAYLGPKPMPLLPRYETMVRRDGRRSIKVLPIHNNNWLQAQENSVDPVHTYYLHGHMLAQQGLLDSGSHGGGYFYRPIQKYDFELCEEPAWAGVRKIRFYGGDKPEKEVGHPAIFPNILLAPQGTELTLHWRVPMDDEHTYIIWSEFTASEDGSEVEQRDEDIPVGYIASWKRPDGSVDLTGFPMQDQMAWETQGKIFDRSRELLGVSDRGVVMWRKLLKEQIERVQAGLEPVGVVRDARLNEVIRFTLSAGQRAHTEEVRRRIEQSAAE
jgi:5,5'-dehydrodivanillate O-demethylase